MEIDLPLTELPLPVPEPAQPYKKLMPRKLAPPIEHANKMIMQDKNKMPKNKILKFVKIFLGEGF